MFCAILLDNLDGGAILEWPSQTGQTSTQLNVSYVKSA